VPGLPEAVSDPGVGPEAGFKPGPEGISLSGSSLDSSGPGVELVRIWVQI
jgi:hypothetical protein